MGFWLGYSQDMAKRAFIIAPEIKSKIIDLSLGQTKSLVKKQKLPAAQEKMAITAASKKVQEMIEGFENVHVYPLVAKILGLKVDESKIDGKLNVLQPILKK